MLHLHFCEVGCPCYTSSEAQANVWKYVRSMQQDFQMLLKDGAFLIGHSLVHRNTSTSQPIRIERDGGGGAIKTPELKFKARGGVT